ncbi:MAG TPA: DUF1320 family protein [Chitinophagaceae bacterium]|nr:DUF1320 family protein [Bacteroidota bacterium]HQW47244.1 DUF1320 family protein [Chitinophagaceae bacterium]
MAFLTIAELETHLYGEITEEINRGDDDITQQAIDVALDEVKGYITKYDLDLIFNPLAPEDRNNKLLSVTKDIAVWHLLLLSNPNVELQIRQIRYEDAVKWLANVQKGTIDPLLPLPAPTVIEGNGSVDGAIKWESNPKRKNHF